MDQITQNQNYLSPSKNNKAMIGLAFGIIGLFSWGVTSIVGKIINNYQLIPLTIFIFGILAVIGIIFAAMGFRSRKAMSVIAIIICLVGIFPSFVITSFMSSIGMSLSDLMPNQTHKDADFSIDIPIGWSELELDSESKSAGIRVAFRLNNTNESFKPIISVISLKNEEARNLSTFAKAEEATIKNRNNFISGKNLQSGTFYQIDYTRDIKDGTVKCREILTVKNGVGYIITAESLESSYNKLLPEFTKIFLSFKLF